MNRVRLTRSTDISFHPALKMCYDLCQEIEKLPASEEETRTVTLAGHLMDHINCLVHGEPIEYLQGSAISFCCDRHGDVGLVSMEIDHCIPHDFIRLHLGCGCRMEQRGTDLNDWKRIRDNEEWCCDAFRTNWPQIHQGLEMAARNGTPTKFDELHFCPWCGQEIDYFKKT